MTGLYHSWRDTLQDLGVIGLVPGPRPAEPRLENPVVPIVAQLMAPVLQEKTSAPAVVPKPRQIPVVVLPSLDDPAAFPSPERVSAACSLEDLDKVIHNCLACPLGAQRLRFVFGEGQPGARILFVGEGPGGDDDLQGRPFLGKPGELLDKMLTAVGLERNAVYLANIVKCRPPDNRAPTAEEAQRCLPYLRRQVELVKPTVIVTLGATPLRELLGVSTPITRVRGQWQRLEMLGGIPVMPTFHPAYVLRQYTQEVRRAVWSDLLAAKKWLDDVDAGQTQAGPEAGSLPD